jgi:hypothetical protein
LAIRFDGIVKPDTIRLLLILDLVHWEHPRMRSNQAALARRTFLRPWRMVAVCVCLGAADAVAAAPSAREDVWFEDVRSGIVLSGPDAEAVFRFIAREMAQARDVSAPLPDALQKDRSPRVVFLSAGDGDSPVRVAIGTGRGLAPALKAAIFRLTGGTKLPPPSWLKLDVVQKVGRPTRVTPDTPLQITPSLQGIAFGRRPGVAFLPEQLVARQLVGGNRKLRVDAANRYLRHLAPKDTAHRLAPQSGRWTIRVFTATSFFHDGRQTLRLFRGHRFPGRVAREEALESARAGGEYLRRSVGPDGRFAYLYRPKSNRTTSAYNLVRHAGTAYSMFDLYGTTRDPQLLEAAVRANNYLLRRVRPYKGRKDVACVPERGRIKLGGVALALLALTKQIEVTGDRTHLPLARRLGRYIQSSQRSSGEFISSRYYPGGQTRPRASEYYPGEAVLALLRLYALDKQTTWLNTAERGARYLIEVRDRANLIEDHWLLYALNELYRFRPRPMYLRHAMRIAQAIRGSQNRGTAQPDHLGSYHGRRSTPTATRTEGLMAAYRLALDHGSKNQARSIRDTIYLNVAFQLRTQFRPESVLYLRDLKRSLGGFHESLTSFDIRIDYVQHNISGLLEVYRFLKEKNQELLAPAHSPPARLLARMKRRAQG